MIQKTTVTKKTDDGEVLVDEFRVTADPTMVICRPSTAKPKDKDVELEEETLDFLTSEGVKDE